MASTDDGMLLIPVTPERVDVAEGDDPDGVEEPTGPTIIGEILAELD
ncbi:MAG: hypothetical protein ACT452_03580 [Microthrixaceae bacterium]